MVNERDRCDESIYYSYVRHDQRYEYVLRKGYIDNKTVLDIGCGAFPYGSHMLSKSAHKVYAIDPELKRVFDCGIIHIRTVAGFDPKKCTLIPSNFNELDFTVRDQSGIVAVCMEVIEHIALDKIDTFLSDLSKIVTNAFFSTPLAETTGPTRNPQHIVEYSKNDFDSLVSKHFRIIDKVYQTAHLGIYRDASAHGCSYDPEHIVQMAWCASKDQQPQNQ